MDAKQETSLPSIDLQVEEFFRTYLKQLDQDVQRVNWNEEKVKEYFVRRSAEDIRLDGTTHYANPCLDLSLVAYADLQQQKEYNPGFLIETLIDKGPDAQGALSFHFVVPFKTQGKNYFLEFRTANEVVVSDKKYRTSRPHVQSLSTQELPFPLDSQKNLFDNLEGFVDSSQFNFPAYIDRIVRTSCSPERYQGFTESIKERPVLTPTFDFKHIA